MQAFTRVEGIAAVLAPANIDTDVIMPKQFLKGITRDDLARGLFYDLRFDAGGRERPEFVLNQPVFRDTRILVVGPNFGCGSSREHAVWGLVQYGIRALIGTGFASIFQDNCYRNGLLPVVLEPSAFEQIRALCAAPKVPRLVVDLVEQVIVGGDGTRVAFSLDELRRDDLLSGRDAIAATLQHADEVAAFERRHWEVQPWLQPAG